MRGARWGLRGRGRGSKGCELFYDVEIAKVIETDEVRQYEKHPVQFATLPSFGFLPPLEFLSSSHFLSSLQFPSPSSIFSFFSSLSSLHFLFLFSLVAIYISVVILDRKSVV